MRTNSLRSATARFTHTHRCICVHVNSRAPACECVCKVHMHRHAPLKSFASIIKNKQDDHCGKHKNPDQWKKRQIKFWKQTAKTAINVKCCSFRHIHIHIIHTTQTQNEKGKHRHIPLFPSPRSIRVYTVIHKHDTLTAMVSNIYTHGNVCILHIQIQPCTLAKLALYIYTHMDETYVHMHTDTLKHTRRDNTAHIHT